MRTFPSLSPPFARSSTNEANYSESYRRKNSRHKALYDSTQATPSLRLDLPPVALPRQSEGEDSEPTAMLALDREGEGRGKDDVRPVRLQRLRERTCRM